MRSPREEAGAERFWSNVIDERGLACLLQVAEGM